ncbi:2'-5' RNA ligase family protein [Nonomuraea africana]|uniref:8-oxo-dGTP pyrophosphatase MutT (NUDIX family)/2'-5' RNA ligase n=1 Tax=Nonomuraea africana TaxID=46171 RepID=A0ABR9KBI5_9ACTN|nr:2'-5' RNA ligase family protein [Nonomuraea africana]MBE1559367.1 8-oxo-dGTP pyrophosphatase MutT (NUDIX family)/2'-5' RNA ligase [Nonomuraea africana]
MGHFEMGQTALVVNVPAAEPVVGRWRERYDSSAAYGVSAHVTVLYPFLRLERIDAGVRAELGRLFAARRAFDVTFRAAGRFPGVLYLAPEPEGPLRELTEAVAARWPEAPPYGGRHPDVVPHLTVADGAEPGVLAAMEADLAARLPFTAQAGGVTLVAFDGTSWRAEEFFPLGDGDYGVPGSLSAVLADVAAERVAQDAMWGVQDLADGTGPERTAAADLARAELEEAARDGAPTWRHVLHEEVMEAFAEADPDLLRAELVQVAAVAVKWAQALGRRGGERAPHEVKRARFKAIVDVHVLFVREGRVLLGRRANTGYADGLWHLPSGHLEEGESAVAGAVREALEEVGVVIGPDDLTFVHAMHRAPDRVGLFFRAERWSGEPYNAEPGKCAALEWHPLDDLPAELVPYPEAALRAILRGEPYAQFGF